MKIKVKKFHPDAKIPEYKTEGATACDIFALEETVIKPKETAMIKTGFALELSDNVFVLMAPRSSLVLKNNLDIPNSVGIMDTDYRGEYILAMRNLGEEEVVIEKHERIGQLIFLNYLKADFEIVEELKETQRRSGGFGSTGKF